MDAIVKVIKSKCQKLTEKNEYGDDLPVPVSNWQIKKISSDYSVILCKKEMKGAIYPY